MITLTSPLNVSDDTFWWCSTLFDLAPLPLASVEFCQPNRFQTFEIPPKLWLLPATDPLFDENILNTSNLTKFFAHCQLSISHQRRYALYWLAARATAKREQTELWNVASPFSEYRLRESYRYQAALTFGWKMTPREYRMSCGLHQNLLKIAMKLV